MFQKKSTAILSTGAGERLTLTRKVMAVSCSLAMGALIVAVTGTALAATTGSTTMPTVSSHRLTDAAIYRDHGVYRDTQERIKARNDAGQGVDDYQLSKAQCWLDVSFHEYSRNDRGGFPQEALSESQRILVALERGEDPGQETPLINGAQKLRPDLWTRTQALKTHAGFRCAAQQAACAEVELVHAGNEIQDAGWRHAKPYVQIAEDLTGLAEKAAQACPGVAAVASPLPVVLPKAPPAPSIPLTLSADALFAFGKSGPGDLLAKGRKELNQLAQQVTGSESRIRAISVIGYTDRMGSASYNQKLSLARANTVKAYLEQHQVSVPISAEGRGMEQPVQDCKGVQPQTALVNCLQPNRRVEVLLHEDVKP